MEEFEGKKRGMLTTGEWCNPVSNIYKIKENYINNFDINFLYLRTSKNALKSSNLEYLITSERSERSSY